MNKLSKTLLAFAVIVTSATPALADFAKGQAAFKTQDYATAKTEFEALPDDGAAIYLLGLIYLNGMGIERDAQYGRELIKKSADIGYIPAQMSMGGAYKAGFEFDKDLVLAHYYYSLAGRNSAYNQEKADELTKEMTKQQRAESADLFKNQQ